MKLQYFGHLIRRTNSLEKTLMLGKTEGNRRRGQQKMRWLDNCYLNAHHFVSHRYQSEIVEDRGAWHAAGHGSEKS